MQPEKIGRYEIKAELGRGGMATVYRGWDPLFEREVAVKVLPPELLHADPQFKLRFEREAKIIASLEHPSIVPVYDVGEDNGQPYFVMRYMNGGSLSERIKAKVMTVDEAVKILGQLAPGMDEAHSKGIVHRDLKPSNILFDSKGVPYISDFGIAKLSQAQSGNMTGSAIIGTPAYMAPEQAQGTGVDGRTDIYAVGIILFEMLTGKQPYEADTPMAVAFKHITDPVPQILASNPNLPGDVENVIQMAMAKNKEDRFATAGDLVDSLRTVASGQKFMHEQATVKGALPKTAVKSGAPKTVKAGAKVAEAPAQKGFNVWLVIIPLVLLGLIGGGYAIFSSINRPVETEAPAATSISVLPVPTTETPEVAPQATETLAPTTAVDTATPELPTATEPPAAPKVPVLGGADKIAFVANNELYTINVDGSELKGPLTTDGATKNDLQWLADGKTILFISGKTIKYYDTSTDTVDTLSTFPSEVSVDAFQVSHDNKQVMIALSQEIYVVPFDMTYLKTVTNRNQLTKMEGACLVDHTPKTPAVSRVRDARWSVDDKLVAWLFKGNDTNNPNVLAEQVSVFDITACKPELIRLKDNFPGTRFTPVGYQNREIPDFDWDSVDQFTMNMNRRNNGWGEMYIYNWKNHKGVQQMPTGNCCYRDARWSPDGTYLFFEFQEQTPEAQATLYYVPAGELGTGANFKPLPLPPGFFKNPKEGAQAALRPAQP
jgi:protein kinase-like protein